MTSQLSGEPEDSAKSGTPKVSNDDQGNTYLRFKGKKSVSLKVTPLVSQGLAYFEEEIRNNPPSPELCLDIMMASHLSRMSSSQEAISRLFFEASVPSVTIQALQRIGMTDRHSVISCKPTEADDLGMSDGIAIVQATCGGLSTSGSVIKNSFSIEVGFRHSSVTLDMSFDKKTVETVSPAKFIFGFVIRNAKISFGEQSVVIDWEENSFDIGHLGPEYVVATGLVLSQSARQLTELHQKRKKNSSLLKQCIVSEIIRCSGDTATVDPLSTIQPSYLVQSGLPHMLRTDTTFRFLHHLRNCLWHLKAVELDTLCLVQDVIQRGYLVKLLEARFAALDLDSYVTQSPLESLSPILEIDNPSTTPTDAGDLYNSITLRFAKLTLIVLDPANRTPSKLTLADVDVKARAFKCDIVQLPSTDLTSVSQTSLREKRPKNILKCSVLLHFGHLTLTVSPQLMGFAQHLLRVQRHFLSVPSPANEAKPASSNSHANIASVMLCISSRPNVGDEESDIHIKLIFPPLLVKGSYDGVGVETIVLIEFAELKVKPSYWDTLLVVQQKFGQDFHDLVTLIQETNIRRATLESLKAPKRSQVPLRYNVSVKMRGFRVGFESPASIVYFECLDISGGINNSDGLVCNVEMSDMAFSLASRAVARHNNPGFNRNHRSAFVIVDFKIDARNESTSALGTVIHVLVTKIHAVMQPSSIGEVGDFVDHIQAEMRTRKEQRAMELAAFKEKTRQILQTFEVGVHDNLADTRSWLDSYIINVSTQNIGVAFPLTNDLDLQLPRTGSRDSTCVSAFLWSIKSIEFATHRGQSGQAEMKLFSFQFISRFRQSVPEDFSGENHVTLNRLVYPQMKAQLRSTGPSTASSHTYVKADVSGFILDLDSSIPSYVFSLIDVYRQGKDRMEQISNILPRIPSTGDTSNLEQVLQTERTRSTLPTSNLFASMTFSSGKVRVYSGAASKLCQEQMRASSKNYRELSDQQVMDVGAEVFNLPVVSVWAEYHAAPTFQRAFSPSEPEASILMFKSTVHSSQNTLRPTLLPFLTELVNHIETRLRRISLQSSPPEILRNQQELSISLAVGTLSV
ncbi:hypothetical protein C0992_006203 [Termitomyces sp. T32_za158]|nr:hypothetical protein C0992_006203 [Termitomyces sp. T32_za158]